MHTNSTRKAVSAAFALVLVSATLAGCASAEKKIKGQDETGHHPERGVYHFICAQEPGKFCQEFLTSEGAKAAEKAHRDATGHADTLTAPGRCP